jgi:dipeptidyl-peptidase-4
MPRFSRAALVLLLAAPVPGALAQPAAPRLLTLDDLYHPDQRLDFSGNPPAGLVWTSETHYLWPRTDPKARTTEWLRVEAATGRVEPFFDAARVEAALAAVEGVKPEEAKRIARQRSYAFNEARTAFLVSLAGDLHLYDLATHAVTRLTRTEGAEEEATFSPDGHRVAFVRKNDLHVFDLAGATERRLTTDGSDDVLNGKLDWVYQEEIYGRGTFKAYWWSPDSAGLAFLRLDEKEVPRYTLVEDTPTRPTPETYPYPKAGDPNPKVRLGLASARGGSVVWADEAPWAGTEILIVDVAWHPTSGQVVYQVQDREQTWLELVRADPATGALKRVLKETSPAWVENPGSPRWLKDGGFLWLSERTGFKHVYRYAADGTPRGAVTSGEWEVRSVHGVDEKAGLVYFSGTERSPIGGDVYRIGLDGTGLTRLSQAPGVHQASFSPGLTRYVDAWSDAVTPTQVRLHGPDGRELRVVDANPVPALAEFRLSRPEFLQVKTRDGFPMEAMLLKPPDFDPSRRYPVYQHTYAGPHAPQVRNGWGGVGSMFHQLLAQKGIVVWICDNRTASGKGASSTWPGYQRLGETELADIEDGIAWLRQQPWVDEARIGLNGWSYGGFMTSYALTHSKSFAMGIAGGSVTSWRNYDSIYTERYMKTPQNNPDGYARTAVTAAARDLHGKLLLIHGSIDDNVHPQNTMQLVHELQKAGKPFELMLYPKSRHGVTDPHQGRHLRGVMLDFIERTLLSSPR